MLELARGIYDFLLMLRIKIKIMPEAEFNSLLLDNSLSTEQRIYLLYFRGYCVLLSVVVYIAGGAFV